MSRFEDTHVGDVGASRDNWEGQTYPDDFSPDEAEFASELRGLFNSASEELPPLYTQTLLENAHTSTAGPGFEQKTAYRVFRRLSLARTPLSQRGQIAPSRPSWRALRSAPRPLALSLSMLLVFMVVTMVLASPAFSAGVRILLGQTGVEQVHGYPTLVHPTARNKNTDGAPAAPLTTSMPISWLGPIVGSYRYVGTQLFAPTDWSNGPIVDIQYTLPQPSAGPGVLDIREFEVSSQYEAVLQVVQDGSATPVQLGNIPAAYVNGAWMPLVNHNPSMAMAGADNSPEPAYIWVFGQRSELIFERNGVVFWIVADQRDGTGESQLVQLVQHLAPLDLQQEQMMDKFNLRFVDSSLAASFRAPIGMEVYRLIYQGTSPVSGTGVFVSAQAYGS